MSDYGFKCLNTNYEVQVDGGFPNFSLVSESSLSVNFTSIPQYGSLPGYANGKATISIGNTVTQPLIAWKVGADPTAIIPTSMTSFDAYTSGNIGQNINKNVTIPYAIFRQANAGDIPSNSFGLAVFNASGHLVWHSCRPWMKIIGVYSVPWSRNMNSNVTVQDAANNYFVLTPLTWSDGGFTGLDGTWWYQNYVTLLSKVNSTTVNVNWWTTDVHHVGPMPAMIYAGVNAMLLLEVSH